MLQDDALRGARVPGTGVLARRRSAARAALTSRRTLHLATGAVAAVLYSNFLIDLLVPGPHEWAQQVSVLEVPGHRSALLLRTTDVLAALLVLSQLPAVRAALPVSRWRRLVVGGAAAFAVGGILAAIVTLPAYPLAGTDGLLTASGTLEPEALRRAAHNGTSILSVGGMVVSAGAAWMLLRRRPRERPRWLGPVVAVVAAGCAVELGADLVVALRPQWQLLDGLSQRAQMLTLSAWVVGLGAIAARPPRAVES
ncbi:DUF998 domain-containing protein [Brachybacterium sp. NBEC-018]|uniref:DUF998 domain-containing protein n=1 Tax=Brachybacterium sp. NBEC-018 TaxID=2996004 RepID=UPI002174F891|nr:DUF998 domain-containing protein [Brachybacterium sp. NBEC-018]UVY84777.1 DUF998 domain-containing protein [Brachybacterium sp. NBEC-018]